MRELAGYDRPVEVNDIAALGLLQRLGVVPRVAGPTVNTYNEAALRHLGNAGIARVVPPPELPGGSLRQLAAQRVPGLEVPGLEVQVFGRWPLAISARCYHAQAYGRTKTTCQYACADDPDGLPVDTLDDQPFLTVNGVQTLSRAYACLAGELSDLTAHGVAAVRLGPQAVDMPAVASVFGDLLDGRSEVAEAIDAIEALAGDVPLANGYPHDRPGADWLEP